MDVFTEKYFCITFIITFFVANVYSKVIILVIQKTSTLELT